MELWICILAAALAGIGTGLVGLSAATAMVPLLIVLCPTFQGEHGAYMATAIALASDILGSAVTTAVYANFFRSVDDPYSGIESDHCAGSGGCGAVHEAWTGYRYGPYGGQLDSRRCDSLDVNSRPQDFPMESACGLCLFEIGSSRGSGASMGFGQILLQGQLAVQIMGAAVSLGSNLALKIENFLRPGCF